MNANTLENQLAIAHRAGLCTVAQLWAVTHLDRVSCATINQVAKGIGLGHRQTASIVQNLARGEMVKTELRMNEGPGRKCQLWHSFLTDKGAGVVREIYNAVITESSPKKDPQ